MQRLNIVDGSGRPRLAITGPERFPDYVADGKSFPRRRSTRAGLVFYNDDGDECGGLVFSGGTGESSRAASASLLFDRLEQDQVIGIRYEEHDDGWTSGLTLWDRPDLPLSQLAEALEETDGPQRGLTQAEGDEGSPEAGRRRMFVGRSADGEIAVRIADSNGRERIRIGINAADVPSLEILDKQGKVIYSAP